MGSNYSFDVVVVGAGIAGLTASYVLAKKGFSIGLIESKPRSLIGTKPCGDAIGLHHFKTLGLHPPQDTIDTRFKGVKIVSPSEEHSLIVYGEGVGIDSRKFYQWLLEQGLEEGVELLDNHTLVSVKVKDDRVEAVLVKEKGKPGLKEVYAKAFIDASGATPALRSKLPREWPISERPYMSDYNIAYREVIELEEPITSEDKDYAIIYLNQEIAPGGYWWFFPKRNGVVGNIGLGVIWSPTSPNPRNNYYKYLKNRFKGKLLDAGGGLVPTRRPLPTLVWKNVGVVGDAAYTVNPVHGGGKGSSMQAATIVATHIANALEEGRVDEETLWRANKEYIEAYGAKQAGLDILRMYLQKLSNEDLEFILKKKIVSGEAIYELGTHGKLRDEIVRSLRIALALVSRPSLLNQLRIVKKFMDDAEKLYLEKYPEHPSELSKWIKDVEYLWSKYRSLIGFKLGPKVPW